MAELVPKCCWCRCSNVSQGLTPPPAARCPAAPPAQCRGGQSGWWCCGLRGHNRAEGQTVMQSSCRIYKKQQHVCEAGSKSAAGRACSSVRPCHSQAGSSGWPSSDTRQMRSRWRRSLMSWRVGEAGRQVSSSGFQVLFLLMNEPPAACARCMASCWPASNPWWPSPRDHQSQCGCAGWSCREVNKRVRSLMKGPGTWAFPGCPRCVGSAGGLPPLPSPLTSC